MARSVQCLAGRISALQFQAVRLACQKHETFLPDGSRAGFFLGDGVSVEQLFIVAVACITYQTATCATYAQNAGCCYQLP